MTWPIQPDCAEILSDSFSTLVVRGKSVFDGRSIVAKLPKPGSEFQKAVGRLRHEYQVLSSLDSPWCIKAVGLERNEMTQALLLEDMGGSSLRRQMADGPLGLLHATRIVREVACGLRGVHAAKIIHQDLSPDNIVCNLRTGQVQIIDFGLSSVLPEKRAELDAPYTLKGALPYVSPEQTGRMNRPVDHRSDFYSLGAIYFEMLTGRPPFTCSDPIEYAYAHVALKPAAPSSLRVGVPECIDRVLLKLLAKQAEDRYQSAAGLVHDLDGCIERLNAGASGRPVAAFVAGLQDRSPQLRLTGKLYGREAQTLAILDRFRAMDGSSKQLILVSGVSGIGKSSLVRELYGPLTGARGYFASGKFDQLGSETPYSGLVAAFSDLVSTILIESDAQIAAWRSRLEKSLHEHAPVITELIPELARLLGPQSAPVRLEPALELQRLCGAFRSFVRACCEERPLVLFLDDLQWVDPASLAMLEHQHADRATTKLLLILAYRNNEVHAGHPFAQALQRMQAEGNVSASFQLLALSAADVQRMIADAMRCSEEEVTELAAVVARKTEGNPLFVGQFLEALVQQRRIVFDASSGRWQWDLDKVESAEHTANVLQLMEARIRAMPPDTQRMLQLASCIGNRFTLSSLAMVAGCGRAQAARALLGPLQQGLLTPIGADYKDAAFELDAALDAQYRFFHDRVQQAAHGLVDPAERAQTHVLVGRRLYQACGEDAARVADQLFEIVNHLNQGSELITEWPERLRCMRLNRMAGARALNRVAFDLAYRFLAQAGQFGGEDLWCSDREQAFELHCEVARAASLSGRSELCLERTAQLKERAATVLERMRVGSLEMQCHVTRGDLISAVDSFIDIGALAGARLPKKPTKLRIIAELLKILRLMRGKTIEQLAALPPVQDPVQREWLNCAGGGAVYMACPEMFPLAILQKTRLTLQHGITTQSPTILSSYGLLLANGFNRIDAGYRFGKLAVSLLQRPEHRPAAARTRGVEAALIAPWKEPLRNALPALMEAYQHGVRNLDDLEFAANSLWFYFVYAFLSGQELSVLDKSMGAWDEAFQRLNIPARYTCHRVLRQTVHNLRGLGEGDPLQLHGPYYDIRASNNPLRAEHFVAVHYRLMLAVLMGDFKTALPLAQEHAGILRAGFGLFTTSCFHFLRAITLLQQPKLGWRDLRTVQSDLKRTRGWCSHQPANHLQRVRLLEAELYRVRGKVVQAMQKYDEAIAAARDNQAVHDEALANELCGRFYHELGRRVSASAYLERARFAYSLWGAEAKVKQLTATCGAPLASPPVTQRAGSNDAASTNAEFNLDVAALGRVTQSIAEETDLHRMVRKTVDAAVRMSGATAGALLVEPGGTARRTLCIGRMCPEGFEIEFNPSADRCALLLAPVVDAVRRSGQAAVIDDVSEPQRQWPALHKESYVVEQGIRSILCVPVTSGGRPGAVVGVLYLESRASVGTFGRRHIELLEIIASTIAARINAIQLAMTDRLTGLANRARFDQVLQEQVGLAAASRQPMSLIMIDIDHFKRVNDTYGHQTGDAVLRAVSAVVLGCVRGSDLAARYGGEEMAVIAPNADTASATRLAERIGAAVAAHTVDYLGTPISVTVSLGISVTSADLSEPEALLRAADEALYRAKHTGRNRVCVAEESTTTHLQCRAKRTERDTA